MVYASGNSHNAFRNLLPQCNTLWLPNVCICVPALLASNIFSLSTMVEDTVRITSEHESRLAKSGYVPRFSYRRRMLRDDGDPNRYFLTFLFFEESTATQILNDIGQLQRCWNSLNDMWGHPHITPAPTQSRFTSLPSCPCPYTHQHTDPTGRFLSTQETNLSLPPSLSISKQRKRPPASRTSWGKPRPAALPTSQWQSRRDSRRPVYKEPI